LLIDETITGNISRSHRKVIGLCIDPES